MKWLSGGTLALAVLLSLAASVDAATLKGRYAFTGSSGCLNSITVQGGVPVMPSGFNSNLTVNGPSFINSHSEEGVATFNGDGTGSLTGTTVNDSFGNANPAANADTFNYDFTYTVALDLTVTLQLVPGTYAGTFTAGPRTGQTFSIANYPTFSGHFAKKSVTLAIKQPGVETITYSDGDVHDRVCHRSLTLTFLGK